MRLIPPRILKAQIGWWFLVLDPGFRPDEFIKGGIAVQRRGLQYRLMRSRAASTSLTWERPSPPSPRHYRRIARLAQSAAPGGKASAAA